MHTISLRAVALLLIAGTFIGCGGSEPVKKTTKPKVAKKTTPQKTAPKTTPVAAQPAAPLPPVDANAFKTVPEAVAAFVAAADKEPSDQERMALADRWMVQQGAAAVVPLSTILEDEAAGQAERIVAARVLVQLPGTKETLLKATASKNQLVRINVIQALGRLKPVDKEVVETCMKLAQEENQEIQRYAVSALGKMGPAAKDAVPLVQDILNDKKYNETVRAEARKTLKAIDPRKGLMGLND